MKDFILAAFSGFLCASFAILCQWYIFRRERYSNRRNVIYYLLSIYGNIKRLDRIKGINQLFDSLFTRYKVPPSDESNSLRDQLIAMIYEHLFDDVLNELENLDENYPEVVEELGKENPTLAVSINHYSRVLDKMVDYIGEVTKNIKKEVNKRDHIQVEQLMISVLHNALISDSVQELRTDIIKISKSISSRELKQVELMLSRMEKFVMTEEEIDLLIIPMIEKVNAANVVVN